jgi:hypothetical protein
MYTKQIAQSIKRNIFLFAFALLMIGSVTYAAVRPADTTVYSFIRLEDNEEFTGTRDEAKIELECPLDDGVTCAEAYAEGQAGNPLMREPEADLHKN